MFSRSQLRLERLILIGLFVVWLEIDELKVQKEIAEEEKKEKKEEKKPAKKK